MNEQQWQDLHDCLERGDNRPGLTMRCDCPGYSWTWSGSILVKSTIPEQGMPRVGLSQSLFGEPVDVRAARGLLLSERGMVREGREALGCQVVAREKDVLGALKLEYKVKEPDVSNGNKSYDTSSFHGCSACFQGAVIGDALAVALALQPRKVEVYKGAPLL